MTEYSLFKAAELLSVLTSVVGKTPAGKTVVSSDALTAFANEKWSKMYYSEGVYSVRITFDKRSLEIGSTNTGVSVLADLNHLMYIDHELKSFLLRITGFTDDTDKGLTFSLVFTGHIFQNKIIDINCDVSISDNIGISLDPNIHFRGLIFLSAGNPEKRKDKLRCGGVSVAAFNKFHTVAEELACQLFIE